MIIDHWNEKWNMPPYQPQLPISYPPVIMWPTNPLTQSEVDDLRKLLERAKKYDAETGQKDCELEEKKEKLRKLAKELGVEIVLP